MATEDMLIPRRILFGNPDRTSVSLSPDGRYLSYVAPLDGVLNVWVADACDPSSAVPVTRDQGRGIRSYFWAYTGNHLIYIQDEDGNEDFHLFRVDLTDLQKPSQPFNLTPFKGVRAQVLKLSPHFPSEMLVGLNKRRPEFHDIYKMDLLTGKMTCLEENDEFAGYVADDQLTVRFASRPTPDGGQEFLQKNTEGGWSSFAHIDMDDTITTSLLGFDKTGQILYMEDSRGRNTSALFAFDLKSGERQLVAEDHRADMADLLIHPTEKFIEGFAVNYDRKKWQILDPKIQKDFDYLKTVDQGDVEIVSRTLADMHWVVAYLCDTSAVKYYLYDRLEKSASYLFSGKDALDSLQLSPMHPRVLLSRDGLNLVSYLSLPSDCDPEGTGRPDKPVPLVLDVHGGPWARDSWGYDGMHQWLTNRGYAVLNVNFRGSTGFGKEFVNCANGQWGRKMHEDLLDAVDWAIAEGITTADKVAIMGGSYGGYATLVGLTFTPERFACGIDIVGPSNLETLSQSIPAYWTPQLNALVRRIGGDPQTEEGRAFLKKASPLTYVDQISKPLLIAQGANDPRVKQAESDQIVAAMKHKGLPVTYLLYPDEGHGFVRPENRLSFFAAAESFLAKHLGGRCEPLGEDFAKSSVQVVEGQESLQ